MAQTRINPKAKLWPYLEAGRYGPGCDNKAECEIMEYQLPSEEFPPYDPEGKRAPYAFFNVQVRRKEGPLVNIRHYEEAGENTGCRVEQWLRNVGVSVADDGTHDDDTVPGKRCIVVAGEPRKDKNNPDRKFTSLRDLLGAGS